MFDEARNLDDQGLPLLRSDRLGLGMRDIQVRRSRNHVLWRHPEEIRADIVTVLAMVAGGIVGGFLIAGTLMNEAVLSFLGIVP